MQAPAPGGAPDQVVPAAKETGAEKALRVYLARHDAKCPGCEYNLRGVRGSKCPECGRALWLIELRRQGVRWVPEWPLAARALWTGAITCAVGGLVALALEPVEIAVVAFILSGLAVVALALGRPLRAAFEASGRRMRGWLLAAACAPMTFGALLLSSILYGLVGSALEAIISSV